MPELKHRPPSYRHHKACGQALVTLNGRDHYLGKYSPESHAKYRQLIGEWATIKQKPSSTETQEEALRDDLRVNELLVAYLDFAKGYYVKNDQQTGEFVNLKHAIEPLSKLYANARVAELKPAGLKAVRQAMIDARLSTQGHQRSRQPHSARLQMGGGERVRRAIGPARLTGCRAAGRR